MTAITTPGHAPTTGPDLDLETLFAQELRGLPDLPPCQIPLSRCPRCHQIHPLPEGLTCGQPAVAMMNAICPRHGALQSISVCGTCRDVMIRAVANGSNPPCERHDCPETVNLVFS